MGVETELGMASLPLRKVWALAWPGMVSELSTPLLGLVDTWVVGHFQDTADLGAIALAVAAYNPLMMTFNFLRMGFGGVIAQAYGAEDHEELVVSAVRGICCGLAVGLGLVVLRVPLAELLFGFLESPMEAGTLEHARAYFETRAFGAPAALSNYVVQAWLINVQRADLALAQNLVLNLSNAGLCVLLGLVLDYGIVGVASATVLANYLAFAFGCFNISRLARSFRADHRINWTTVLHWKSLVRLASLNGNVLLRSVCMMLIVTDFTSLSGRLGLQALAGNNLLMQLQMLISFGADGFANAGEALVGEAIGRGEPQGLRRVLQALLLWGVALALAFTVLFVACGREILCLLTSHVDIVDYASEYLPWQWVAPALSLTAYLMDGIFVGASRPDKMRDATFLALVVFWVLGHAGANNDLLWAAYMMHLLTRASVLLYYYPSLERAAAEAKSYREHLRKHLLP